MARKSSPRKVIESDPNRHVEQLYVKFPLKDPAYVGKNPGSHNTETDFPKVRKFWRRNGRQRYSSLHTHPYLVGDKSADEKITALPSAEDLANFFMDDKEKATIIAQRSMDSGEIRGYLVLRKTKETPEVNFSPIDEYSIFGRFKRLFGNGPTNPKMPEEMNRDLWDYKRSMTYFQFERYSDPAQKKLAWLLNKYHVQSRFLPAKGSVEDRVSSPISSKVLASISFISLIGSLFLISMDITGNVIVNLLPDKTSLIAGGLFLIGLIASFFYFKLK